MDLSEHPSQIAIYLTYGTNNYSVKISPAYIYCMKAFGTMAFEPTHYIILVSTNMQDQSAIWEMKPV